MEKWWERDALYDEPASGDWWARDALADASEPPASEVERPSRRPNPYRTGPDTMIDAGMGVVRDIFDGEQPARPEIDRTEDQRAARGFGRSAYGDQLHTPIPGDMLAEAQPPPQPRPEPPPDDITGPRGISGAMTALGNTMFGEEGEVGTETETAGQLAKRRGQEVVQGISGIFESALLARAISPVALAYAAKEQANERLASAVETGNNVGAILNSGKSPYTGKALTDLEREMFQQRFDDALVAIEAWHEKQTSGISGVKGRRGEQLSRALAQWTDDTFGVPPRDNSLWSQLFYGTGSMVGFMLPTVALTPFGTTGAVVGLGVTAQLGSDAASAETYETAIREGASERDAVIAAGIASLWGYTEAAPIASILNKVPDPIKRRIVAAIGRAVSERVRHVTGSALANAVEEALQEGSTAIVQNLVHKNVWDPEREIINPEVGQQALVGAILGSVFGGLFAGKPSRLTDDDKASPLTDQDIEKGKAIIEAAERGERLPGGEKLDEGTLPQGAVPLEQIYEDIPIEDRTPPEQQAPSEQAAPVETPAAESTTSQAQNVPESGAGTTFPAGVTVLTNEDLARIEVDPETFQYKAGGDERGVTNRLRGVKRWDNIRSGWGVLYEYANGRTVIVDGHQRLELARRADADGQEVAFPVRIFREVDGYSEIQVRAIAAEKNIAEGSGSALDAAKVMRDLGLTPEEMDLPMSSTMVRNALAIKDLSKDGLGMLINGIVTEQQAAIVGALVKDKAKHVDILGLLARAKPDNLTQAEAIVRQADAAEATETQTSLFGEEQVSVNLYEERAKVLDRAIRDLGRDIQTFKTLTERGDVISAEGNILEPEANQARLGADAQARASLMKQANMKGWVSDALTEAARSVRNGAGVATAAREFVSAIRRGEAASEGGGAQAGDVGSRAGSTETGEGGRHEADDRGRDEGPSAEDAAVAGAAAGPVGRGARDGEGPLGAAGPRGAVAQPGAEPGTAGGVGGAEAAGQAEILSADPDTNLAPGNIPDPSPTDAQKEAENYAMGHIAWNGLDISIETAKGQERTGKDADGETWSVTMPADYGRLKRTKGADGEQVDIYLGDMPDSDLVLIVNQIDLETGKFDEHKIVAGTSSRAAAYGLYEAGFSDGKGRERIGSATVTSVEGLKAWLETADHTKPTEPVRTRGKPEAPPKPSYAYTTTWASRSFKKAMGDRIKGVHRESPVAAKYVEGYEDATKGRELNEDAFDVSGSAIQPYLEAFYAVHSGQPAVEIRGNEAIKYFAAIDQGRLYGEPPRDVSTDRPVVAGLRPDEGEVAPAKPQTEQTPEGEQTLIPGVKPITEGDRNQAAIEAGQKRPLKGGDQQGGGRGDLFGDPGERGDLFDKPAEKPKRLPGFIYDNPGGDWLKYSQENAEKAIAEAPPSRKASASIRGSITATSPLDLSFSTLDLRALPGLMGEARGPGDPKYDALAKDVEENGWQHDQRGNRVVVAVNHLGKAYLMEGNTRVALAARLGIERVNAEVRYWNGGERAQGEWSPAEVVARAQPAAKPKPAAPKQPVAKPTATGPKFEGPRADNTSLLNQDEQDRLAELKARMRRKLRGQINAGLDPEIVTIALEMAGIYVKAGARKFRDLLRAMMEDMGLTFDQAQPYARNAYNQVRDDMELDGQDISDMDSSADVVEQVKAMRAESAEPAEGPEAPATAGELVSISNLPSENLGTDDPGADAEALMERMRQVMRMIVDLQMSGQVGAAMGHMSAMIDAQNLLASKIGQDAADDFFDTLHDIQEARKEEIRKAREGEAIPTKPNGTPVLSPGEIAAITENFQQAFENGEGFDTIVEARRRVQDILGRPYEPDMAKALEEAIEVAIVKEARRLAATGRRPASVFKDMVDLYDRQPNLAQRTSSSIEKQAYSTPVPLAYLASRLAGISDAHQSIYEPTAGNGALLVEAGADSHTVIANELDESRADALRDVLGDRATVVTEDATTFLPGTKYSRYIANPPFGRVRNDMGQTRTFDLAELGGTTPEIDHAIVAKGLSGLRSNGRAVLIIGGQKGTDAELRRKEYTTGEARTFFKKLYDNYRVTEHFTVAGRLYSKQGAQWPVDVIVIEGKGEATRPYPMREAPPLYDSWDAIGRRLDGTDSLDTRQLAAGLGLGSAGQANQALDPGAVPASPGAADRPVGAGGGRRGGAVAGPVGGTSGGDVAPRPGVGGRPDDGGQRGAGQRIGDAVGDVAGATEQAEGGSDTDAGTPVGADAGRLPGEALSRPAVRRENQEVETEHQVQYEPRSKAKFAVGTLVPRNMQTAMGRALDELEERVGDIDQYVARELGYNDLDAVLGGENKEGYFSAEQMDALALAIDNISRGKGYIIGDQTGVGKGRFVAAMLKYARRKGLVPVFMTKDPGLYADMVRDMRNIGMEGTEKRIFVTNRDLRGKQGIPLSANPQDKLFSLTPAKMGKAVRAAQTTGKMPDGFDMIFTTYSQMQQYQGRDTDRMDMMRAIAPNAMFVLDESHEAGGEAAGDMMKPKDDDKVPRSQFIRALLADSHSAVFSSATYAKNPSIMSLYAKTDLSLVTENMENLAGVIEAGGIPLQQVFANMLVESGQYSRRERTFDGVSMNLEQLVTDKSVAKRGSAVLRSLFELDLEVMQGVRETFIKEAGKEGLAGVVDGAVGKTSMTSVNFSSIMHNVASQYLLSIKVDAAVDEAIKLHKQGKKVLIAVSNTNASILTEHARKIGVGVGGQMSVPFNVILERYLDRLRRITLKDENKKTFHYWMTDDDIVRHGGQGALDAFYEARDFINQSNLEGLPGSPIDHMLDRLEAAGLTMGEITGRNATLRGGVLENRDSSAAAKKVTMREFNAGDLDGVILNRSGSTGYSMHALDPLLHSDNDGKKRHMIILQPEPDIALFMQILGRIHRTGQSQLPDYTIAVSDLAIEKRLAAVLMKKLASLNANTTASKRSAVSLDNVVDFMNQYGDKVVQAYLQANPQLATILDMSNGGGAIQFTGRLMSLDDEIVTQIYEDIETEYRDYIETLDRLGMNALEAKVLELDAKTLTRTEFVPAKDPTSPFGQAAYIENVDVKKLGRPYTPEEVETQIEKALDGKTDREFSDANDAMVDERVPLLLKAEEERKAAAQKKLDEANTDKQKEAAQDRINRAEAAAVEIRARAAAIKEMSHAMRPGMPGRITVASADGTADYAAISLGADMSRLPDDRLPPNVIRVRFAIADAGREIVVPMSKMMGQTPEYLWQEFPSRNRSAVLEAFKEGQTSSREERQMITGNIASGYAKFKKGQIVLYTDDSGSLRQGVILPKKVNAMAHLQNQPVRFPSVSQAAEFLESANHGSRIVVSEDNVVRTSYTKGQFHMLVASGSSKKYSLNKAVRALIGDFEKRGGKFFRTKSMDRETFERVLTIYKENLGTEYSTTVDRDAARQITGETVPEIRTPGEGGGGLFAAEGGKDLRDQVPEQFRDLPPGSVLLYARPELRGAIDTLTAAMRKEAERLGVPDVPIEVYSRILGRMPDGTWKEVAGQQEGGLIRLALSNERGGPRLTMKHEVGHLLRNEKIWGRKYGLFRKAEWDTLVRKVKGDRALLDAIRAAGYRGEEIVIEEAVFALYEEWVLGRYEAKGFIKAAFERIARFIEALGNALRGNGFRTVEDVFATIDSGEMGRRQADMAIMPNYATGTTAWMPPSPEARFAVERELADQADLDAVISGVVGERVRFAVDPTRSPQARQSTFLSALLTQPVDAAFRIPFMAFGGLDQQGRWTIGKAAHKRVDKALKEDSWGPLAPLVERVRYGMIDRYGLPEDYVERERRRSVDEAQIAQEGKEHLQKLAEHDVGAEEARVLQAILTGEDVSNADMEALAEPIREAIDSLGAQAVDLGLISRESYERNKGKYLHRIYTKYEAEEGAIGKWAKEKILARRRRLIGNQLKGRGLFEEVEAGSIFRGNEEFAKGQRGTPQMGDRVIILDLRTTTGTDALPGVEAPKGRLRKRIYWPADRAVPEALNNYESRGEFEVRARKGKNLILWRDFTKDERLKMGEILDARYTIARTYHLMAHDLATGRFFDDIAKNEEWSRKDAPPDVNVDEDPDVRGLLKRMWVDPSVEWVKVPTTKITKSDSHVYGNLAGRYVRADIWRDMQETRAMQTPWLWQRLLTQWKMNMTARSPSVHMNNVVSNVMLMDMADVRVPDLIAGITSMIRKDADYREALLAGAFGADVVTQEFRQDVLEPLLDKMRADISNHREGIENNAAFLWKLMDGLWRLAKKADRTMINAYQMEDQVFRMATYIRRRNQGATIEEAAIEARDQFLNYDIRAPWVNAARRSVLPFVSYTYRAVPKIAQTLMERPWKIAKYATIYWLINALGYELAPSEWDEEEERKSLSEHEQGGTWLPGVERMVRMPYLSDGNPVFLDVRRWIPAGDVFETAGDDIPAWLQIGGPLVIGMELYLNRSAFTEQDIVNKLSDTALERATKRADFLWKSWAPSAFYIPYSWYFEQLDRALQGDAMKFGERQPYTVGETALSSIGIKLKPKDVEIGYIIWKYKLDAERSAYRQQIRSLARQRSRNLIDEDEYQESLDTLEGKMEALRQRGAEILP